MQDSLNMLVKTLPDIARLSRGYVSLTRKDGKHIHTADTDGNSVNTLHDAIFPIARSAGQTETIQIGPSPLVKNMECWALPVGEYVLVITHTEIGANDLALFNTFKESLPLIARITRGEAVLYDKEGKRLYCVDYNGNENPKLVGHISKAAKESMRLHEPTLGKSSSVVGAMAVRIPITKSFGLGLNNEQGVKDRHKLIEDVKKFQYAKYSFDDIIGNSEAIARAKSMARHVANGISSILLYGETGTGKELFAQSIHNASERSNHPFVAINCGALPASIIESYLFGYVEGAFTGAKKAGHPGAFEQANGGTILLDEISEMDYDLQSKLLRVLQEREVTRIGSYKPIKLDVRVIASTNRDLAKMVREGKLREDLYFRLNIIQITIPPLRDRLEDIPDLVKTFVNRYNEILGKYIRHVDQEVFHCLTAHDWSGNVRELHNCIEHAMNMVNLNDDTLRVYHLPIKYQELGYVTDSPASEDDAARFHLDTVLRQTEHDLICKALKQTKGVKKDCAELLGISTVTLWRKMKELNIQDEGG